MSGQESIKGYLFQSLIAVLKSMNGNWSSICVEPKTEFDKVDIIWRFTDQRIEVSQVKSSIRNFSSNDIFNWLQSLTLDYKNAEIYSVYLVGNSSYSTKILFNSIKDKSENEFPEPFKDLFKIKEKLQVFFEPNNIETLEDALIARVDKFFFSKDILTDYPTKKLIANGMVNQIMKISTTGKVVNKDEFESHLLEWIIYNYSKQVTLNKVNFELKFYYQNQFFRSISDINLPNIETSNLFLSKKRKVKELYEQISKYDFEIKTFEKEFDPNDLSTLRTFKSSYEYNDEPVIISNYEINLTTKALKRILNIEPNKEFFNFGELKESRKMDISYSYFSNKTSLNGTEIEKEKKNLYNDFYWKLIELTDLLDFWQKISKLSFLPIVIENTGKLHNEEIRVQLSIPDSVKVIKTKSFPIPKRFNNLKDLNSEDSFLFQNIRHVQNSAVNEYDSGYLMPPFINLGMFGNEQEEEKFRSMLDYYFEYSYYYDKPKITIIECCFKELNTNEILAFPTYIFFKSKKNFTINYEITCKNEPGKITGTLEYKANT